MKIDPISTDDITDLQRMSTLDDETGGAFVVTYQPVTAKGVAVGPSRAVTVMNGISTGLGPTLQDAPPVKTATGYDDLKALLYTQGGQPKLDAYLIGNGLITLPGASQ